jgi:hypothetical protein
MGLRPPKVTKIPAAEIRRATRLEEAVLPSGENRAWHWFRAVVRDVIFQGSAPVRKLKSSAPPCTCCPRLDYQHGARGFANGALVNARQEQVVSGDRPSAHNLRSGGPYSIIFDCFLRFRLRARACLARFFSPGFR